MGDCFHLLRNLNELNSYKISIVSEEKKKKIDAFLQIICSYTYNTSSQPLVFIYFLKPFFFFNPCYYEGFVDIANFCRYFWQGPFHPHVP